MIRTMFLERLPSLPEDGSATWTNNTLCTNEECVLTVVAALRLHSLPTGPADFHPANVTVKELRAGINMLTLAGPAANESPEEVS
jgi:hypothetical protein